YYILLTLPSSPLLSSLFIFTTTSPSHIYTLSLHDALPISSTVMRRAFPRSGIGSAAAASGRDARKHRSHPLARPAWRRGHQQLQDRKSTRLNSSHVSISYAVFCLKKKKK